MFVSANYFGTIGVALARGPGFDGETDGPLKAAPVVILGYNFWQNRLDSDPDIVGKTMTLNNIAHVVVGIAPPQFDGHIGFQGAELYPEVYPKSSMLRHRFELRLGPSPTREPS